MNKKEAKLALDKVINKSRVHLYKPIQIAEILYHHRIEGTIDLNDLETYRNISKKWRDEITKELLGSICTSSAKFQDNLFDNNAIPPNVLSCLGEENVHTGGAVEAYIYRRFEKKHLLVKKIIDYCKNANTASFSVKELIDSFWEESGLKRSLDKIYEIVVYSLFITIIDALELKISLFINDEKRDLLEEFKDFTSSVIQIDLSTPVHATSARVFRVGVTNAADRGLDMYANWGPAIQIKHLTLSEELAESIVESVSSDRIIIVCKNAEQKTIVSLLNQIGWRSKIQSIITEENLIEWYERALRGAFSKQIGNSLLLTLVNELENEFPSVVSMPAQILERHYENISDSFWK